MLIIYSSVIFLLWLFSLDIARSYMNDYWKRYIFIPIIIISSTIIHHLFIGALMLIKKDVLLIGILDMLVWYIVLHEFRYKTYDWYKPLKESWLLIRLFGFIFYLFGGVIYFAYVKF